MFSSVSRGNPSNFGIYATSAKVPVTPNISYLKKSLSKAIEKESDRETKIGFLEGPERQEEIREINNIGYKAKELQAEVIDKIGAPTADELGTVAPTDIIVPPKQPVNVIKARKRAYNSAKKRPAKKRPTKKRPTKKRPIKKKPVKKPVKKRQSNKKNKGRFG